jgi:Holliday junction resolvase-like predicted endonuclease
VQQLEALEPGLRLVKRQLSTPAGRLDLLCKDINGNHVVIELKPTQGTDQVVGQILRYMGWLKEEHPEQKYEVLLSLQRTTRHCHMRFVVVLVAKIEILNGFFNRGEQRVQDLVSNMPARTFEALR